MRESDDAPAARRQTRSQTSDISPEARAARRLLAHFMRAILNVEMRSAPQ